MKKACLLALVLPLTVTDIFAQDSDATQRLLERNRMFEPAIIEVAENVYTAIGYQVSTNTMIVGDDGVIIIDPGQRVAGAEEVRAEFERITDKPVRAIVYTHGHGDHTNGSPAFYDPDAGIEVWARSNYGSESNRVAVAGARGRRAGRRILRVSICSPSRRLVSVLQSPRNVCRPVIILMV